jgi:nucleoid DNA-binding protein
MPGIREISRRSKVKAKDIEKVFMAITVMIGEADGQAVKVQGFGAFYKQKVKATIIQRSFINDGEPVQVDDSYIIKFRQARRARQRLNEVTTSVERDKVRRARTLAAPVKKKLPPAEDGATAVGAVGVRKKVKSA